jgi:hypothetical protein
LFQIIDDGIEACHFLGWVAYAIASQQLLTGLILSIVLRPHRSRSGESHCRGCHNYGRLCSHSY